MDNTLYKALIHQIEGNKPITEKRLKALSYPYYVDSSEILVGDKICFLVSGKRRFIIRENDIEKYDRMIDGIENYYFIPHIKKKYFGTNDLIKLIEINFENIKNCFSLYYDEDREYSYQNKIGGFSIKSDKLLTLNLFNKSYQKRFNKYFEDLLIFNEFELFIHDKGGNTIDYIISNDKNQIENYKKSFTNIYNKVTNIGTIRIPINLR